MVIGIIMFALVSHKRLFSSLSHSITSGEWSIHDKEIGSPMPSKDTKIDELIGAERELRYDRSAYGYICSSFVSVHYLQCFSVRSTL
jgi:hypothetical protein